MTERPILFSGPMVRAILAEHKTQTRRIIKPQPHAGIRSSPFVPSGLEDGHGREVRNRYGRPGDSRLWVRESFDFIPVGGHDDPQACEIVYWADGSMEPHSAPLSYNPMIYNHPKIRSSIHMPRWASRILLEIVSVRVQRLQDISEDDAYAEGVTHAEQDGINAREGFAALWNKINGAGAWNANPWVWIVKFRRVEQ